jgi:phosphopantetheinyl transferase (holo-ACP synthase)
MDTIKDIYLNLADLKTGDIGADSIISRKNFSSVMFDRFVAALRVKGIAWDGTPVRLGDLTTSAPENSRSTNRGERFRPAGSLGNQSTRVGIDIELEENMPAAKDYWSDPFYQSTFSKTEIAHCIVKDNPNESFAGIYACKEALVKIDNSLRKEEIEILFDENGRPSFDGYAISISHAKGIAVAVAVYEGSDSKRLQDTVVTSQPQAHKSKLQGESKTSLRWVVAALAIISLVEVYLLLKVL